MSRSFSLALISASGLVVACQSTPSLPAELTNITPVAVAYAGSIEAHSWLKDAAIEPAKENSTANPGTPTRSYGIAVYTVAATHRLTPHDRNAAAHMVDAAIARNHLAAATTIAAADQVTDQSLALQDQQTAWVSVLGQTSYVASYTMRSEGDVTSVDPQIAVANDGIQIELRTDDDGLKVVCTSSQLERPMQTTFAGPAPVRLTLQVPVFINHRLTAAAQLADGQGLLLTGITLGNGRQMVALIEASPTLVPRSDARYADPLRPLVDHSPIAALLARPGLDAHVRAIALAQVATARGDWHALLAIVRATRAHGTQRAALEEGFLQGILFYGFPRTITAFEVLQREWPASAPPTGGSLPATSQPHAGRALFRAIYDRNADAVEAMLLGCHGELRDFVLDVAYGRILTRPALSSRERELIAVAVLAAMDQTPQLVAHARGALRFGADELAVREALWSALAPNEAAVDTAMAKIVRSPRS